MERYLITQSLIASWAYMFDCHEGCEDDAKNDFLRVLNRERVPPTDAMKAGQEFEREVYAQAAGLPRKPHAKWEEGIQEVAEVIRGAPVQLRYSRPLEVGGINFLVYGVLDALKAGIIYDVKFSTKSLSGYEAYGKYLNSPQHPSYFYLVPEATEFKYLLSDGKDLYIETYPRDETESIGPVIQRFIRSISEMNMLGLYKEKWLAQ